MRSEFVFGYEVFEDGRVVSKRGELMRPSDNGRGYLILGLMIGGKRKTKAVHKLVALAFVENPKNLPEVNHKDGNKANNHWTNLEWCSRGENIRHAYSKKLRTAAGEYNSRCKTTESTVRSVCRLIEQGFSASQIRDMGFDYSLVRKIKNKQNWTNISKEYSF